MTQRSEVPLGEKHSDETLPSNLALSKESYEPETLSTTSKITHAVLSALFISYGITITVMRNPGWHIALILVILAQLRVISYYISFNAGLGALWSVMCSLGDAFNSAVPRGIRRVVGYAGPMVLILAYVLLKGDTPNGTRVERLISLGGMCMLVGILTLFSEVAFF
jgi:hypothetical protein